MSSSLANSNFANASTFTQQLVDVPDLDPSFLSAMRRIFAGRSSPLSRNFLWATVFFATALCFMTHAGITGSNRPSLARRHPCSNSLSISASVRSWLARKTAEFSEMYSLVGKIMDPV